MSVIAGAAVRQARRHETPLLVVATVGAFATCEVLAVRNGITDNILWPPSTPRRAVALAVTLSPLAGLGAHLYRRSRRRTEAGS